MSVGGISGGSGLDPAFLSILQSQGAATEASVALLDTMLDMATQMNAQLVEAMRAASPAGAGGSVDTWA